MALDRRLKEVVSMVMDHANLDDSRYKSPFTNDQMEERVGMAALHEVLPDNKDRHSGDCNKFKLKLYGERREDLTYTARNAFLSHGLIKSTDHLTMSGASYYTRNCYMGWHTNRDQPGVRIYCNWALHGGKSGLHYFHYGHDITRQTSYDKSGWNFRMFDTGYFHPFWHAVWSQTRRISIGFRVIPSENY